MSGTHEESNSGKRRSISISFIEQFLRQGQQGRLAALLVGKLDAFNRIATTFGARDLSRKPSTPDALNLRTQSLIVRIFSPVLITAC